MLVLAGVTMCFENQEQGTRRGKSCKDYGRAGGGQWAVAVWWWELILDGDLDFASMDLEKGDEATSGEKPWSGGLTK